MGFVYEAMGVHSSVINGEKQVEDIDRDEMVCCSTFSVHKQVANVALSAVQTSHAAE